MRKRTGERVLERHRDIYQSDKSAGIVVLKFEFDFQICTANGIINPASRRIFLSCDGENWKSILIKAIALSGHLDLPSQHSHAFYHRGSASGGGREPQ